MLWILKAGIIPLAFLYFGSIGGYLYLEGGGYSLNGLNLSLVSLVGDIVRATTVLVLVIWVHHSWLRRRPDAGVHVFIASLVALGISASLFMPRVVGIVTFAFSSHPIDGGFGVENGILAYERVRLDLPWLMVAWTMCLVVAAFVVRRPDPRGTTTLLHTAVTLE